MGHFVDYQWARDLGCAGALTEGFGRDKQTDADVKQFLTNFDEFIEHIDNSADLRSEYTMDRKEVFARFVSKFVQWVDIVANGKRSYPQEYMSYNDKFTTAHYVEFVRLLQEKSMIDSKRFEANEKNETRYSIADEETATKNLEIKANEEYNGNTNYSLYTDEVMFSSRYTTISQSQNMREMYDSAKKGNVESAYELLSTLLKEDVLNKIESFGNNVYLMPIVGAEGTSTNILPSIIAKYISVKTGQGIFKGVYKKQSSNSRDKAVWARMKENYPSFVIGKNTNIKTRDIEGKQFVLLDDNSTTGRTFIGLKNFLEENGGKVVGYYALTTGQDQSEKMITTDETWNELFNLGLNEVKEFAEKEGVKREISKLGLTEREAQELIKQFGGKNTDTGRRNEGSTRSRSSSGKIREVHEAENENGRTEKSNKVKFSIKDEIASLSEEDKEIVLAVRQRAIYSRSIAAMSENRLSKVYSNHTVMKNGKFDYYQIHDADLYSSIAEFTPKQLDGIAAVSNKIMQPICPISLRTQRLNGEQAAKQPK